MPGICDGRVVLVTGAGRGIGREEAEAFAREGAKVIVNDLGVGPDGAGTDNGPAREVAKAIVDAGGEAIANTDNVANFEGAKNMIDAAVDHFGRLDTVVNNAGILRDRMLVNMTPDEWDDVIHVHLRGTYAVAHHAALYWREQSKSGTPIDARLITTSSASGIFGNVGQSNYGAAKAGIAAFTVITAKELARYGVTVNSIAPAALTRLTAPLSAGSAVAGDGEGFDRRHPGNIAPLVVWLGSGESGSVTGRVFTVGGGEIGIAEGWVVQHLVDKGKRWHVDEIGAAVGDLVAQARPAADMTGRVPAAEG